MKFEWAEIEKSPYVKTERAKVIGGWLVYRRDDRGSNDESTTMVFISDLDHDWEIEVS